MAGNVSLLQGIGAAVKEGKGSRVRFEKGMSSIHIHKPHPGRVLTKYSLELARDILMEIGVKP
jgi:hypothetical protein